MPFFRYDVLYNEIMALYVEYLRKFPYTKINEILWSRYGQWTVDKMTVEQLRDLISYLQKTLLEAA